MDAENDSHIAPEIAEYPESGPYWVGLWAVARHWVAILANIFEPDVIASTGITRHFALRCRNWLWAIEGLLRRLIIAAALKLPAKLDVAQLPRLAAGRKTPARPLKPAPSVAFVVLPHLPGRGRAIQPRTAPRAAPPEHRHLVFPGDTLLSLFPRHDKRNARPPGLHNPNPLHRRGRRSRWDPDYQCDPAKEQERYNRHFFGPLPQHPDRFTRPPQARARADRSSPDWKPRGTMSGDLPEWRRIEQEWERVIPSRGLAGRINALVRVMQAPERWIARTARKLSADLVARLRAAPPPRLKRPKLDRSPAPPLTTELAEAHAQAFPDTS